MVKLIIVIEISEIFPPHVWCEYELKPLTCLCMILWIILPAHNWQVYKCKSDVLILCSHMLILYICLRYPDDLSKCLYSSYLWLNCISLNPQKKKRWKMSQHYWQKLPGHILVAAWISNCFITPCRTNFNLFSSVSHYYP